MARCGQLLGHRGCRSRHRPPGARRTARAAAATSGGLELGHLGAETLDPVVGGHELVEPGRAAPGPLEHLVDGLAVLARQDAEGGPALLHVAQSLGVEVDVLEVCREVGREVRDERADLVQPLVEPREGLVVGGRRRRARRAPTR